MKLSYLTIVLILTTSGTLADDSAYNSVRDNVFWPQLYNHPYQGLYCGRDFPRGHKISVEHIYPTDWIAEANGCDNRSNCPVEAYRRASSDLHNLWPAEQRYNSSRGDKPYGEIPGNTPRFTGEDPPCDFERTSGSDAVVEPRDSVKGEIARSMLYMIWKYDLPDHGQFHLMIEWNFRDPPEDEELSRYIDAQMLQGRRNPYIEMWF